MIHARLRFRLFPLFGLLLALLVAGCSTSKKTTPPTRSRPAPSAKPRPAPSAKERQFRQEVIEYALQFQGAPYKYAGTSPISGFDCSGFTSFVLKEFKVNISPASSAQSKEGKSVGLNAVQPGDIIVFGKNQSNIQHVALVVERTRDGIIVVHSTTSRGVIRENISTSAYWKPLILSARDMIGQR